MEKEINKIIEENFDKQILCTADLIKIKSVLEEKSITEVYPLGEGPAECLKAFLAQAENFGFKTKNIDNMVGWAEIGSGEKLYGILCHLDTVPEGNDEKWTYPPFSGEITDGKIYGRGAIDDKGPTIAALFAMKALLEQGEKLKARFRLIVGLDEETSFRCAKRYMKTEEVPSLSFSPDSSFPLTNGEKGILQFSMKRTFAPSMPGQVKLLGLKAGQRFNIVPDEAVAYFSGKTAKIELALEKINDKSIKTAYKDDFLEVTATGLSAHAMQPEKGINAIQKLLSILSELEFVPNEMLRWIRSVSGFLKMETDGKSLGISMADEISGAMTINTAMIRSNGIDVIISFDMRYPVTSSPEAIEDAVKTMAKKFGMMLRIDKHINSIYIPADTIEIKTLLDAYESVTGEKGEAFTTGGGTYCKEFPRSVAFGAIMPGEAELAHEENEYASLETLKKATKIYGEALYRLNNL